MRKSVEKWISSCKICQKTKPAIRKEVAPLGKYMAGEPMERIAIDVMGPFPEKERGNKLIVIIFHKMERSICHKGSQSRNHCKATGGGIHWEIRNSSSDPHRLRKRF